LLAGWIQNLAAAVRRKRRVALVLTLVAGVCLAWFGWQRSADDTVGQHTAATAEGSAAIFHVPDDRRAAPPSASANGVAQRRVRQGIGLLVGLGVVGLGWTALSYRAGRKSR
jgi:hypothetical protein